MSVIEFKNVTKHFKIYQNKNYSLKEKFLAKVLNRDKVQVQIIDVLKDASFKIEKGETVGIIGENGTGKSTSLKLISNILKPNAGEIIVNGKISSLLEIGVGFQPDLSGRENVYMYGSILGLTKLEIDKRYDGIVEFAELSNFMDTPVKNYSSGMYMRLAFSVAVSVDPDILLVDEVLAVGDANFQKKCLDKIQSFKEQGKTIVFVSHDMGIVKKICNRVIFIKKGGFVIEDTPDRMIGLYMKLLYSSSDEKERINKEIESGKAEKIIEKSDNINLDIHEAKEFSTTGNRDGNKKLEITKVYFSDNAGMARNVFNSGEDIKVNLEIKKKENVEATILYFDVFSEEGWRLSYHNCNQDGILITDIKNSNFISFVIQNNPFLHSKYYISVGLCDENCDEIYDYRNKHYYFIINEGNIKEEGKVQLKCDWRL
ncbi:ABC transporter ATP-binding protein [Clostridium pasteurianum]|uniref:ABC-type polysaccharide/polyol phosphate transport system, ATPase component n=1 Tax=Clostridium pasteurianum BC1 TaxID=86416 RepID=R4K408_CLOPA|nr:ABC transporter ATP-binding protein [Clostridium pasteurianum]AGK97872.1 ABC-type polysaccharide/polyol phosphate transport system, ATPase component [Clostridium pasteurianum BC1]